MDKPKAYNPPPTWMPPGLDDVQMYMGEPTGGQKVTMKQPKDQFLFKLLKILSETRLQLDRQTDTTQVVGSNG